MLLRQGGGNNTLWDFAEDGGGKHGLALVDRGPWSCDRAFALVLCEVLLKCLMDGKQEGPNNALSVIYHPDFKFGWGGETWSRTSWSWTLIKLEDYLSLSKYESWCWWGVTMCEGGNMPSRKFEEWDPNNRVVCHWWGWYALGTIIGDADALPTVKMWDLCTIIKYGCIKQDITFVIICGWDPNRWYSHAFLLQLFRS